MLLYPHRPKQNYLEEDKVFYQEKLNERQKELFNGEIWNYFGWKRLIDNSLKNLFLCYSFEEPLQKLLDLITQTSSYVDQSLLTFEYVDHTLFIQYLSIATLAKDYDTLKKLLNLEDSQLENPAFLERDYPRICAKIIRYYHQKKSDDIQKLMPEFRTFAKVSPQNKRFLGTLVELIQAIINQDSAQIEEGIMQRQKTYIKTYKRGDEKHSPESLLDIDALGILARGYQDYQITSDVETVYLPRRLWQQI